MEIVGTQSDLRPSAITDEGNQQARGRRGISAGNVRARECADLAAVRMRNNAGSSCCSGCELQFRRRGDRQLRTGITSAAPHAVGHHTPHSATVHARPPTTCSLQHQLQRDRPEMLRKRPDYVMILPDVDAI